MRALGAFLLCFGAAVSASAVNLDVVNVAFPGVNCKFDTDCKITVTDTVTNFTLPGAVGSAFLQSRTWPVGQAGTPGAGRYAYLYRVDLTQLTGALALPCVTSVRLDFGPVIAIDYDGNGDTDQVFVGTAGGLGSVGLSSAVQTGNQVTFNFSSPVCAGSSPGHGQTSYFFGLASGKPPKSVTATVTQTAGGPLSLAARAPQILAVKSPKGPKTKPH